MTRGVAVILFVVLAGCGRISFDAQLDAAIDANEMMRDASTLCDQSAPFTSITRIDSLSTFDGEGGMRVAGDDLTAYFHSDRPPLGGGYGLFRTTRATRADDWSTPTYLNLGGFFPNMTADELTLIYDGGGDIYVTTRASAGAGFTPAASPAPIITTANGEASAYLSPTETSVYFARVVGASTDLFVATWPLTSERALSELNTGRPESNPVVSADELTLYYAVDVQNLGIQIWRAQRASTSVAFGPGAIVSELDSVDQDAPTGLSADNCRLYFESTRGGVEYNLFVAERQP